MNSNFQFLGSEFPEFYQRAQKAEQFARTDARTSLLYARMALELAIGWMYTHDEELEMPYDTSLHHLMVNQDFKDQLNVKLYNELHIIRKTGNLAAHNKTVSEVDSLGALDALYYFAKWFAKSYSSTEVKVPELFDYELIPEKGAESLSKNQIQQLKKEQDKEREQYLTQLKAQEEELKRLKEDKDLVATHYAELQKQIEANKAEANQIDAVHHPQNEAETRKYLIDLTLREAGWETDAPNVKEFKVTHMPKSTNPSGMGYADYVLWDDDGLPLAVVEAKRSIESVTQGENQAQLYAEALEKMYGRRPVMFYTNGYEIYLWDDLFYKQARQVFGFYTKAELQRIMFRRENRGDIRTAPIDTDIAGRYYQMRAIKSIAEHFSATDKRTGQLIGTHRGALLVLATGTGKTRTAIAFSKLLFENNWAKRILFLADRVSLVKQAKSNFVKLLPNYTSVNLIEEKDNPDARIAFSTYQTMMGLIDSNVEDDTRFYGVGHFDLIIVDEAHRYIYKKYQTIFDYFDTLFLGLTATPINHIDRNTYEAFGLPDQSPTDAYTFDQAVKDGYLTPYKTIEVPTRLMTQGIKYSDLSEEEQEEFENEILEGEQATGNEWVSNTALNQWLFNEPTAIETLKFIIEHGIKKQSGDELGKTIIFARNQKHAHFLKEMFMKLDPALFGNEYVKVITHNEPKSQEFIERFCDEEKDRDPQIAISVDMMDTGIDAPSCVNLVFYKPVKSYAKFWQMKGRGSRLRPDLFGVGKDKTHFLIFDLCGNFEFFDENPDGVAPTTQKGLTEILFNTRLQLAQYLKSTQFADHQDLQDFRIKLLDGLHHDIASLNLDRFDVKMRREIVDEFGNSNREVWNHLSKGDIQRIEEYLAPLVKSKEGDTDMARFYDKLIYNLIIKRLETPNEEEFIRGYAVPIQKVANTSRKLLKKTTIPAVKAKEEDIKLPLEQDFWKIEGIAHLEKLRENVRHLVKYIDPEDQRYVTTNFTDTIQEDKVKMRAMETPPAYGPSAFQNNVHRLETLIRANRNHITIQKIKNGEPITQAELQALEQILFSKGVDENAIQTEMGEGFNLTDFIVSLMGLSEEKVEKAFAEFRNQYQLNAVQIEFLETIKKFFTTNGKIEPAKLYEPPFISYNPLGVDGVFNDEQTDRILEIVQQLNEAQ
ncbi:DUF4145 domain-containing protein [Flavobacteriaceae bacterium Ap0902]|nr:DUF4145 domain-containing protein [Flavobacteriaceae bacterium Ap0902]